MKSLSSLRTCDKNANVTISFTCKHLVVSKCFQPLCICLKASLVMVLTSYGFTLPAIIMSVRITYCCKLSFSHWLRLLCWWCSNYLLSYRCHLLSRRSLSLHRISAVGAGHASCIAWVGEWVLGAEGGWGTNSVV